MLFAFLDDGTLDVIDGMKEAQLRYEAIDVENEDVIFYDDEGKFLWPYFVVPNKKKNFFGLTWVTNGVYKLTISEGNNYYDLISIPFAKTIKLNSNHYFKTLDDVKNYFRKKGVVVDQD